MFVFANDTEYMNSLAEDVPACFSGAEMQIVFQFDTSEGKKFHLPPHAAPWQIILQEVSSGLLLRGN